MGNMIIRMYPKNGLKGLQLLAQSNALGKRARRQSLWYVILR